MGGQDPWTSHPSLSRSGVSNSLTSQTLSKRISRELLTSILRGEIAPGQALPSEDDLASQFDVSRPVVREAVKELAVLGLVESRQGRSTRVTQQDDWNHFAPELLAARSEVGAVDDFLLELLELRRLIETGAAGLAAAHASEDDIEKMTRPVQADGSEPPAISNASRTQTSRSMRPCSRPPATTC